MNTYHRTTDSREELGGGTPVDCPAPPLPEQHHQSQLPRTTSSQAGWSPSTRPCLPALGRGDDHLLQPAGCAPGAEDALAFSASSRSTSGPSGPLRLFLPSYFAAHQSPAHRAHRAVPPPGAGLCTFPLLNLVKFLWPSSPTG